MDCQLQVRRGEGDGIGTFTRLTSSLFFRRFSGGGLQLLGIAGLSPDGNISRTDTTWPAIPFAEQTGIGQAQTGQPNRSQIRPYLFPPEYACMNERTDSFG
jgi:hypothetical protein